MLEVLDKLAGCELFRIPTLDLTKVERMYCSTGDASDFEMALQEARNRRRQDIIQAIETLLIRSAWLDGCRRLLRKLRGYKMPTSYDKRVLAALLGPEKPGDCSMETSSALDTALAELPILRDYFTALIRDPIGVETKKFPINDSDFCRLEHALLSASLCEHPRYAALQSTGGAHHTGGGLYRSQAFICCRYSECRGNLAKLRRK